jgi:GH15 family glucan-1,4-alpha-glucosidase
MCATIYIGALCAMADLLRSFGDEASSVRYEDIAQRRCKYLDEHVWNSEYYAQNVMWTGLREQSFERLLDPSNLMPTEAPEVLELLRREGPKYQYEAGCLSDGVIGA